MKTIEEVLEFNIVKERVKNSTSLLDTLNYIDNLKPYKEIKSAQKALDLTDEAVVSFLKYGKPSFYLNASLKEYIRLVLKGHVLSEGELKYFHEFNGTLEAFRTYLSQLKRDELMLVKEEIENLFYDSIFLQKLFELTEFDGMVKHSASPLLTKLYKEIDHKQKEITEVLRRLVTTQSDYLVQKEFVMKDDRLVLAVKREFKNKIKGMIHSESQSGETIFLEPEVSVVKNLEIMKLKDDLEREKLRILTELTKTLEDESEEFLRSYEKLIFLDFLFAKAYFHTKTGGEKPVLNTNGRIDLHKAFHPLLVVEKIIKNDLVLLNDTHGLVITGPNTGGKTIILKMLGLFAIMVKHGFLISAAMGSEFPFFESVFADIGDEQSISQNLSTFSGHLKRIIKVTNDVTKNSLVLLDELGSGTDPKEGTSLAIAIFTYLVNKEAKTIITTHYSELKMLAYEMPFVKNASMEFNSDTFLPTYKIKLGHPGVSNAIVIAKRLGLKKEIVELAEAKISDRETDTGKLIESLTVSLQELEREKEELANEKFMLREFEKELKEKASFNEKKLKDEYSKLTKSLEKTYEEELIELKESFDKIVSLKEKLKDHELSDIKRVINKRREIEVLPKLEKVSVGDEVFIESLGIYGTVIKMQGKNKYIVSSGNMSLTLPNDDLVKVLEKPKEQAKPKVKEDHVKLSGSLKIDLRGLRVEEAKDKLLDGLEDAYISHLQEVIVVHGYGTGAVRKMVWEVLPKLDYVKSYRYGGTGEGLNGATVVAFKE